jgi:predicted DNA-binding WGR domain protein
MNQARAMLRTYGRQLTTARRLARYLQSQRPAGEEEAQALARAARRKMLVEQVSREIVENLLVTGSENETVREIRQELEAACGPIELTYPPAELGLRVFRPGEEGPVEIVAQEKQEILATLWAITLAKVDRSML